MQIHTLRMQGLGIRKIATVLGISRNAVRRALRSSTPPTGKRQRPKGVKLTPFHSVIAAWMADPIKRHWTAERIFDELQELGYAGGRTVLKEYLLTVRPKPRPQAEARFFVRPGQQMQVAIARLGLLLGEMFDLEALAEDAARTGRYEYFVVSAPLNLRGGVGSPANALALR